MKYPAFTGDEPCRSVGTDSYYPDETSRIDNAVLKNLCVNACAMYAECYEWSLHHEGWGFWAGMTNGERRAVRRTRNIIYSDPMSHVVFTEREVRDAS